MKAIRSVLRFLGFLLTGIAGAVAAAEEEHGKAGPGPWKDEGTEVRCWTFDKDPVGKPPEGWSIWETNPSKGKATWEIVADEAAPSKPNVLSFVKTENTGQTFNLAIAEKTSFKDLDLSVKLRANSGEEDQGGGLIWRAKDEKNYFVCRNNPLEGNYRVYKVVDGKRTQLATVDVKTETGKWYTLRATTSGDQIVCYLDGKRLLETKDDAFKDAGMIGLWTKADAASSFDDLEVRPFGRDEVGLKALPENVKKVLAWLPGDTETLFVIRGPLVSGDRPLGPGFGPRLLSFAAQWLGVGKGAITRALEGRTLRDIVEGSRKFLDRTGIPGGIVYESCEVLRFDGPLPEDGRVLLGELEKAAEKVEEAAGVKVFVFSTEWGKVKIAVALPKPDVICVGMGDVFIREVLERIGKHAKDIVIPADLPEWQRFDPRSRGWAFRHFVKGTVGKDVTTLLGVNVLGVQDPKAVGVVFELSVDGSGGGVLTLLSGSEDPDAVLEKLWKPMKGTKPVVQKVNGGASAVLPAALADQAEYWLLITALLGQAILI